MYNDNKGSFSLLWHILKVPLPSEFITIEDMEGITIDNDILTNQEVSRSIELLSAFVLILFDFQELTFIKSRVLLRFLINTKSIIIQEKDNNEMTIDIFRFLGIQTGFESQLDLVIHPLEIILFRSFGHQSIHLAKSIFFISKTIIRRNNYV
jgi:hypothetical protein